MNKRCVLAALVCGVAVSIMGGVTDAGAACSNANALGVSRVLTVDTAAGPQFGSVQYHDLQPLKDKEVVLTFDDGPSGAHTPTVLAALAAHCTKATFFMVGRMAAAYPKLVRQVAADGHSIGLHTWSHRNLKAMSARRAAGEIELGASVVSHALGRPTAPFFRFPYLADPNSMISYLKGKGVGIFSIDIDSYDFRTRSGARMQRTVMRQLKKRGRGIILMHDIQTSTARGIRGLLDALKEGGYKVVHVVPKSTFKTRAEYDAKAVAMHSNRRYLVRAAPVADPALGKADAESVGDRRARRRPAPHHRTAAQRPRPTPAAAYARPSDDDWKRRVLGLN
jgi:peptidoglycan/xylan/chitin deacetylase (PgdA/CDA1 family)